MSISIEQVLADAKRLVERLRSHDSAADALIQQTSGLNKRIETMTEFQEEIEEMNNIARHRPRTALILGIQRENRQIRQLQEENAELVASLKQHQAALDLIMSSYREQITKIRAAHKSEHALLEKHSHETGESPEYVQKILEMASVMQKAADFDETYCFKMEETVSKLEYENKGLRELLRITKSIAKATCGPISPQTPQSGEKGDSEKPSQANNDTIILNSPQLGGASRVERGDQEEESKAGESSASGTSGSKSRGQRLLEGSIAVVDEIDLQEDISEVDSGGGRHLVGEKAKATDNGTMNEVKTLVTLGAISDMENVNKNNNQGSEIDTRTDVVQKEEMGPNKEVLTPDGTLPGDVESSNDILTNCNTESNVNQIVDNSVSLETTDSLLEENDTSSISSQSSMSTVKEVDSLSITSELSDSGGELNEKIMDHDAISVDATHL